MGIWGEKINLANWNVLFLERATKSSNISLHLIKPIFRIINNNSNFLKCHIGQMGILSDQLITRAFLHAPKPRDAGLLMAIIAFHFKCSALHKALFEGNHFNCHFVHRNTFTT